MDKMSKIVRQE